MRKLRTFFLRLGGWWGRAARERQLQDELEAHFQMHVDDNLRAGMAPAQARREAALKFGSVASATEEVRGAWTVGFLETTRQDVAYAVRALRRTPAFTATAVLSVALGIGASVAIFTVADSLLLRPLPYRDPGRLMMIWENNQRRQNAEHNVISPANFRDWKAQNTVFEAMSAFTHGPATLQSGQRVEEVIDQYVTGDVFDLLGVGPVRGRLFTPAEDLPGSPNVALISYRLWQNWFAGDDGAVGRTVTLRGHAATIIGVMPQGFYLRNRDVDVWEALGLDPARDYRKSSGRYLFGIGRLKPGVAEAQAAAQMHTIAARLTAAYPEFDTRWGITLEPFRDSLVRDVKTSMLVLLGAVMLLLAVACANVASLLLARHTARRREMAVRAALGAGRWRVVRQLITESLVLGATGGALGILLARAAVAGLVAMAPQEMSRNASIQVDARIVAFAAALSILSAIVFGLLPSLAASRDDVQQGLRDGARGATSGHGALRNFLVAAEVALSVMLLTGAGLLVRSVAGLEAVKPGLDAANVLTFHVSIPSVRYPKPAQVTQFFERALTELRRLPGVERASAINYLPFHGIASGTHIDIGGRPPARPGDELSSTIRTVMPGYFHTMGIPLVSGRDFTDADNVETTPYRFIVNQAFVAQYLAGQDPLRATVSAHMQLTNPFGEIVGITGDLREGSVDQVPRPTIYYVQSHMASTSMVFVLRTAGAPLTLAEPARRVIRGLDPDLAVADIDTMDRIVRETFARQRFSAFLLTGFSAVALLLAGIGIYGVLAYSVTQRTREFGVRVALGAAPGKIVALVLGKGARLVLAGIAAGLASAMALTGLLKSLLFGVGPHDVVTLAGVPLILGAVALLASWLPARRAARMPPVDALRAE
ncbi:MAG: ABC transporter permease [Candidatus Solibacter sp.]